MHRALCVPHPHQIVHGAYVPHSHQIKSDAEGRAGIRAGVLSGSIMRARGEVGGGGQEGDTTAWKLIVYIVMYQMVQAGLQPATCKEVLTDAYM